MSDIIFKDANLTKTTPAWMFFHSNEEKKLVKCKLNNFFKLLIWKMN